MDVELALDCGCVWPHPYEEDWAAIRKRYLSQDNVGLKAQDLSPQLGG